MEFVAPPLVICFGAQEVPVAIWKVMEIAVAMIRLLCCKYVTDWAIPRTSMESNLEGRTGDTHLEEYE